MDLPWHLYLMAILYFVAGINHFLNPAVYVKIIPPFFFHRELLNKFIGAAEILLALFLCVPDISVFAAWGIICLLFAVFPANIYMYVNEKAALGLPKWLRLIRLPLQVVLILWAYQYTGFIF